VSPQVGIEPRAERVVEREHRPIIRGRNCAPPTPDPAATRIGF
jgi:hypothetical protein